MKSIQQRLQSRISRRRNAIRAVEQDVSVMVTRKRAMREMGFTRDNEVMYIVNETITEARGIVKVMANDQRLDKQLASVVYGSDMNRLRRMIFS